MTDKKTYPDSYVQGLRCTECKRPMEICDEMGCDSDENPEPRDIMADYEGPDNPNAMSEQDIEAESKRMRFLYVLEALLLAAWSDLALEQSFVDALPELDHVEFGDRSLKFHLEDGSCATFWQNADRTCCEFEIKKEDKVLAAGHFCGRRYAGMSHYDIFRFFFDEAA